VLFFCIAPPQWDNDGTVGVDMGADFDEDLDVDGIWISLI